MNIIGISTLFSQGIGIKNFDRALKNGWHAPEPYAPPDITLPCYKIPASLFKGHSILKKIRRADRFCKMAALTAWDAVQDSKNETKFNLDNATKSLGIILTTAFGPHVTTFNFLDDILDFGDTKVSPTRFSHSVHNAAASYIATILGCRGPTVTHTEFSVPFTSGLLLAQTWLNENRCKYILLGMADELGPAMAYISQNKLNRPSNGRLTPFACSSTPTAVPGEGCVFFLLTNEDHDASYCQIDRIEFGYQNDCELAILEASGMHGDESGYRQLVSQNQPCASYTPVYGSLKAGDAFAIAAGSLILKKGLIYENPSLENPHHLNILPLQEGNKVNHISVLKITQFNKIAAVNLKKI